MFTSFIPGVIAVVDSSGSNAVAYVFILVEGDDDVAAVPVKQNCGNQYLPYITGKARQFKFGTHNDRINC